MKLNEFIKGLRAKYNSVSLKKLATKKQYELYHFCYKNKREQNEIVLINKKTKEVCKREKVKKNVDIKRISANFKKGVKEYSKQIERVKRELIEKSQENGVRNILTAGAKSKQYDIKLKELEKKKNADTKFRNEKQKKDSVWLFMIASMILEFLKENGKVEIVDDVVKSRKDIEIELGEKKLLELYLFIVKQLQQIGVLKGRVKFDIVKINADKLLDIVFNRYNNKIPHYRILMCLYMIDLYKYEVKNKELFMIFDKNFFENMLDNIEKDLQEQGYEEYRENSQKLAYELFKELYNKKILTKQEVKEFFKKMNAKKEQDE